MTAGIVYAGDSGSDLEGGTPNTSCTVTTHFPDGTSFTAACVLTILPAGRNALAPKGMVRVMDAKQQVQVFSLNFFPPRSIKLDAPYLLTTDNMDSFLNGIVQQLASQEMCRMNREFPASGTVTFTAVGANSSDYHGRLQAFPACYVKLGTPEERLVPGAQITGGKTTVRKATGRATTGGTTTGGTTTGGETEVAF